MLVLSRQKNELIRIGDEITIAITDVRGDKVRVGITAPKHIPVHREEIFNLIHKKKQTVTVCSKCLRASCFHGANMCENSRSAGTVDMTIDELKKLDLEDESWWKNDTRN